MFALISVKEHLFKATYYTFFYSFFFIIFCVVVNSQQIKQGSFGGSLDSSACLKTNKSHFLS